MIKNAHFIKSAILKKDWIIDNIKEICLIGRSNVGKSSFINALTNQNKLAKTSSTPGKTRLLNFFDINNGQYRIVDAPGYGYAKINKQTLNSFANFMEEYLLYRSNLAYVILLLDSRHNPSKDDIQINEFLQIHNIATIYVITKLDKLKKNDVNKNINLIKRTLNINEENDIFAVSILQKQLLVNFTTKIDKLLSD